MPDKYNKVVEFIENGEVYKKTLLTTMEKSVTGRGLGLITFKDNNGNVCEIQDSSLATEPAIWFRAEKVDPKILASKTKEGGTGWVSYPIPEDVLLTTRMHLTQEQVKALLPILTRFAETGEHIRDYNIEK